MQVLSFNKNNKLTGEEGNCVLFFTHNDRAHTESNVPCSVDLLLLPVLTRVGGMAKTLHKKC